jgi:uncharacterized protein YecT (DUF1311 family)
MKTKSCLAVLLLLPAVLFAQDQDDACLLEPEADRRVELFDTAQRAWLEYRDATCELVAERDRDDLRAEAVATCLAFYDRERDFELRLMSRVLTFTNVRSILESE